MILTGSRLRDERQKLGLSQARLAELTGVAQHLLSSFELGKVELPPELIGSITTAIAEKPRVLSLVHRNKRYQDREYAGVPRLPERLARTKRTKGNAEYCMTLQALARASKASRTSSPVALSLFSGCGGFSLGVAAAGFEVKGFLELDPSLRRIYKANFPHSLELGGDITKVNDSRLAHARELLGKIDIVIGGPPCQGFSLSGKRCVEDPRNLLFKHYMRFVDALRPKIAIMENVRLLTSMRSTQGILIKDAILQEFRQHGYDTKMFELNAKDYGVPQHRERVLFLAAREDLGIDLSIPFPTHGCGRTLFAPEAPYRTFADACSDLPYLETGDKSPDDGLHEAVHHPKYVVDWLWDVPEGCSAHDNPDPQKRPQSGYNTTYKRQVWHEPASTVQTTFGMISGCRNVHPVATRSLTIREAARIQSFPDDFLFQGSLGAIRKGIGNAVPPLVAYCLAAHVRTAHLDLVEVSRL